MARVLSHQQARRVYDRIGSLQDSQVFYEDRAIAELMRHADFGSAEDHFEFGCGTGRLALRLFTESLSPTARYRGVDVSPKMVALARARRAPYSARAQVALTEGGPPCDEAAASTDRFVSTYVFDLLSEDDIRAVLHEAHRMLRPQGLLCLTSLSTGVGPVSRAMARIWSWIQAHQPSAVGGCRPIDMLSFLAESSWRVRHRSKLVAFGVPSEVLVAQPCTREEALR